MFGEPTADRSTAALASQYSVAEQAFQRGDIGVSQTLFEAIVRQVNDQPLAQLRLGLIYQKQHRFRQAMSAYDEVLLLPPGDQRDDLVRSAQMKARFNRAILSLQAAAEDLEHIEPDVLDEPMDKGRAELRGYVQAALAVVGDRASLSREKTSDQNAKGVVLVRVPPVRPVTTSIDQRDTTAVVAERNPVASTVVIRGGMNDAAAPRLDKRTTTPR